MPEKIDYEYKISHITDLVGMSDEQVIAFSEDLPSIVSRLRIAHLASVDSRLPLSKVVPYLLVCHQGRKR